MGMGIVVGARGVGEVLISRLHCAELFKSNGLVPYLIIHTHIGSSRRHARDSIQNFRCYHFVTCIIWLHLRERKPISVLSCV